jgi:hypothetical protein
MTDRAHAVGKLHLPQVTLVAASSVALPATVRALRLCMDQVQFAAVKLFTDHVPAGLDLDGIDCVPRPRLGSRNDYSRFMLKRLHQHVETPHVLCVQWDGYLLNAANWRNEFLAYDYIGAPWPQFSDGKTVGNGGFSLRSLALLKACADDLVVPDQAEDLAICRTHRTLLEEQYGLRFAPEGVARHFSYERTQRAGDEFGFHGVFNMRPLMGGREFRQMLGTIETGLLGKRERKDIARIAFLQGDIRLMIRIALLSARHHFAKQRS